MCAILDDDVICVQSLYNWSRGTSVVNYTGAHHQPKIVISSALILERFHIQ